MARSWIVLELTGSSKAQGSIMLASAVVVAFFILKGGALVDRGDAKKIMFTTQFLMGILVLCLAVFCEWGQIQMWHLLIFAVIEGVIMSYDSPTFLAVVVRLVDKEDFQQAMALNSTNFHIGRMLGPVVAGVILAYHGPSLVFFIDAIGFFIVCAVLYFIKVAPPPERDIKSSTAMDLNFFLKDQKLRYMLGQLFLAMVTIFPIFVVVLKTFSVERFGLNAAEFGQLFMFPAMGSVLGSLAFAVWKPEKPLSAVKLGMPFIFLFYILLPHVSNTFEASIVMAFMGFAGYLMFAAITVALQLDVPEEYRGRVSSLVGLAFGAIGPFACYPVGAFADLIGETQSIQIFALLFALTSLVWYLLHRKAINS